MTFFTHLNDQYVPASRFALRKPLSGANQSANFSAANQFTLAGPAKFPPRKSSFTGNHRGNFMLETTF